jgi:WD40 repeat protein
MSPQNKELKSICIENSKKVLSHLIINYPMIAFHSNMQKLAVGSVDGKIFIYDMSTGSMWKNLNAHNSQVSAVIFDSSGNSIISYSAQEHLLKCWKIGLTNFFGNFFSMKEYRSKLEDKVKEILGDTTIDESRIATEVVIYADKICVDEETVRLRSHINHARKCLSEDGGIGRKMDFIAQEMNRESNTILSKANDIEISNAAIDLKTEIEKVREQIQNIE